MVLRNVLILDGLIFNRETVINQRKRASCKDALFQFKVLSIYRLLRCISGGKILNRFFEFCRVFRICGLLALHG